MGAYISSEDLRILEDSSYYSFPYNSQLKLSAWSGHNAKNFDYYNGNRFCKISRRHYPEYTRGILFGYWYSGEQCNPTDRYAPEPIPCGYNPIETIEEEDSENLTYTSDLEREF